VEGLRFGGSKFYRLIRYKIFHNIGLKIISFLLALLLWFFVKGEVTVERTFQVPIKVINLPNNLILSSKSTDTLNLTVRGDKDVIARCDPSNFSYQLDLRGSIEGSKRYKLLLDRVVGLGELKAIELSPAQIELTLTKKE
jgi:YbbR domain-containing protein